MAPETFQTLLAHVESGETLKASLRAAGTSWRSLSLLIERDEEAASRYARARTVSADFYADRAQEAVESALTVGDAQIGRVKADVYKWRAAKANPRVYGDKVDVTSDGKAIQAAVVVMPPESIPEAQYEVVAEVQSPHILSAPETVEAPVKETE